MQIFQKSAEPFVVFVEKYYPNPFVFVIVVTALTFLLAIGLTDISPVSAIEAWGGGLSRLLAFMAQLSLTLIAAYALAHTDLARQALSKLARLPSSQFQAYFLVTFIAGISNLIAWSLGLVVGALIARQVAIEADRKNIAIHYPLLVASAYAGFVLWHMGYSSSSALFVATPGHSLEELVGIIPVTETIFSGFNLILALITLVCICIVCPLMHPKDNNIIRLKADVLLKSSKSLIEDKTPNNTVGKKLDNSRIFTVAIAILLIIFLIIWFATKGLDLNLNIVNWTFLAGGLLLARNVQHYMDLVKDASKAVGEILIQYPFYAGIMGLMATSGLVEMLSNWFATHATSGTLSFLAFLSGGIVNLFIPSGGGQWVIQGPVFLEAGQKLGVNPATIVLAVSYGDQWTNMIQPFWTIPLLAIAGLNMRQIMGYTFVILLVTFLTFGGGLLLLGA